MGLYIETGQRIRDLPNDESVLGVRVKSQDMANPQFGTIIERYYDHLCPDETEIDIEWDDGNISYGHPQYKLDNPVVIVV